MGKDEPYAALWRLLDLDRFAAPEAVWRLAPAERPRYLLRRLKEQITDLAGGPLFPPRTTRTVSYSLTKGADSEEELYGSVTAYCEQYYGRGPMHFCGIKRHESSFCAEWQRVGA